MVDGKYYEIKANASKTIEKLIAIGKPISFDNLARHIQLNFGLSETFVKNYLDRLVKLGLIYIDADGNYQIKPK